MRSETGNSKNDRLRNLACCAAVISLGLTSCAAQQPGLAQLGPAPYFALSSGAEPTASLRPAGSFAAENGCVIFKPANNGPAMTPVFPKGQTALVTDGVEWLGLYLKGAPVVMGEVYRLSGAQALAPDSLALETPTPAGCPSNYFVVRSVGKPIVDANVNRYCGGVSLCTSYALY